MKWPTIPAKIPDHDDNQRDKPAIGEDRSADKGAHQGAHQGNEAPAGISPKLLELLVCPLTRGPLVYDHEAQELVSHSARLAYPVINGIPIMLPDQARTLEIE